MIVAYNDGVVELLQGDCRGVAILREPYVLVTDPPFRIRSVEHVDAMLASFGWHPTSYVVLTNPAHGYVSDGRVIADDRLRPIGGAPTFERPLRETAGLLPLGTSWRAGMLIFDPFAGTGTTLVAARIFGMRALGIERSEAAIRVACERLANVAAWATAPPPRR